MLQLGKLYILSDSTNGEVVDFFKEFLKEKQTFKLLLEKFESKYNINVPESIETSCKMKISNLNKQFKNISEKQKEI